MLPKNMNLPEMSLRFILNQKEVSTSIVGMRNVDHVIVDTRVADGKSLPDELIVLPA